jgi:hypothetical protein
VTRGARTLRAASPLAGTHGELQFAGEPLALSRRIFT